MKGVPTKEQEEYGKKQDDCWRCGRSGHWTYECFSFSTLKGMTLPTAPWKVAVVGQKREREEEEPPEGPAPKQQKVAAAETMDMDPVVPPWEDSDSDF